MIRHLVLGIPPRAHGLALMACATASFTAMITFVKTTRAFGYTTPELMGWRAWLAVPALLLIRAVWTGRVGLSIQNRRAMAARCVFGAAAMFCFFHSTRGLGIGEISVLSRLQPIWVAVVAPLMLGNTERAGPRTWMAVALGWGGTMLIAWPTLGESAVRWQSVLTMLGSGLFSAIAHTSLRAMKDEDGSSVVLWFQVFVGSAATLLVLGSGEATAPAASHLVWLFAIALSALAGQLLMTRAYALDRAPRIAAAAFLAPVFGFAVDQLAFGVPPTLYALIGAACIVGGGAMLLTENTHDSFTRG